MQSLIIKKNWPSRSRLDVISNDVNDVKPSNIPSMETYYSFKSKIEVKIRVKARQVREIWFQQLEHKQFPKRERNPVSGRVSVPCWHATPLQMLHRYHS